MGNGPCAFFGLRVFRAAPFVCALALAGGEPPRAKGALTFGKLTVAVVFRSAR